MSGRLADRVAVVVGAQDMLQAQHDLFREVDRLLRVEEVLVVPLQRVFQAVPLVQAVRAADLVFRQGLHHRRRVVNKIGG